MIKRFPSSRNQRSKGVKIKHVLQVILLLGVCFWLIYQVKHNHDKKKDFDKNDSTLPSVRTETGKVVKHGRKDLNPVKNEVDHSGKLEEEEDEPIVEVAEEKSKEEGNKHGTEESEDSVHEGREEQDEEENKHGTDEGREEQDEEENKHGTDEGREEQDEEENKHGTEEQEEGENKTEEIEDEGGDVEVDENDHEKSAVDNDQDDDDADELKDKVEDSDEMENEEKEDEEKRGSVENDENHEAREEHYKGDDASSAVAHDTHATSTETKPINLTQAGLSVQMNIEQPANETIHHSDENNRNQNDSDLKDREGEVADAISSNVTSGKETGNNSLSAETNSDSHLDVRSNLTAVITEASSNTTGAGDDASSSSEQIKTVILSESDSALNTTASTTVAGDIKQTEGLEQSGNKTSEGILPDNDATISVKPKIHDAAPQETPTLGASALEKSIEYVASNETENISGNLDKNVTSDTIKSDKSKGSTETSEATETQIQNTDATVDEMFKGNTQTGETDENSDSSANEILDAVIHDAIDSSDAQNTHEDMATTRTDLDTLPDIQNEGNEGDENSAE